MAQEHVDLVQRGYEAFARRDLDALADMMHPDIEAHDPPEVPDAAVHRGRDAVLRDWQETLELFDDLRIEVEDIVEADGDDALLFVRYSGRGVESGAAVEARIAHFWTFRDGLAIRFRQYLDHAAAIEAAGLAEQEIP